MNFLKTLKISVLCSLAMSFVAMAEQPQAAVYPARAGEATQPGVPYATGVVDQNVAAGVTASQEVAAPFQQIPQAYNQTGVTDISAPKVVPAENNNPFLQPYTRRGMEFSAKVFYQNGQKLVLKNISQEDLKKAVVVFFGEWCPHCDTFLKSLAANLDFLRLYNINIIFVSVPSLEILRNWRAPNLDEYNVAENKISAYGIKLTGKKTSVVALGDKVSLVKNGIEALPVFIAIKDGQECYRTLGEKATTDLNFSNQETLKNFLKIWDEEEKSVSADEVSDMQNGEKSQKKGKSVGNMKSGKKSSDLKHNKKQAVVHKDKGGCVCSVGGHSGRSKISLSEAREATKLLNNTPYDIVEAGIRHIVR